MLDAKVLQLHPARGFLERLKGLAFSRRLEGNRGLWFPDCRSVHTLTMTFPIDIVFLGASLVPVRTEHAVPPGRILWCPAAASIVELQAGYIRGNPGYADLIRAAVDRIQ
ncbi:MAG: DUF192 domain-containing protein [Alcaligenaceae bacterium]|nr:DUF192 domain-containing protein [Alcaligenaceae bacterium]